MLLYQIKVFHELKPHHYTQRHTLFHWCMKSFSETHSLRQIVFTYEYVFYVCKISSTQNTSIWGSETLDKSKSKRRKEKAFGCPIHDSRVRDVSYFFYKQYERRLLRNAEHVCPIRDWKVPKNVLLNKIRILLTQHVEFIPFCIIWFQNPVSDDMLQGNLLLDVMA